MHPAICIGVDPWVNIYLESRNAWPNHAALTMNDSKRGFVVYKPRAETKNLHKPILARDGIVVKLNIDELRENPIVREACDIADSAGILPMAIESHVLGLPEDLQTLSKVRLVSAERAAEQALATATLLEHEAFRGLDHSLPSGETVVDARGFRR